MRIRAILYLLATIQCQSLAQDNTSTFENYYLSKFPKVTPELSTREIFRKAGSLINDTTFIDIEKDIVISQYLKSKSTKLIDGGPYILKQIYPVAHLTQEKSVALIYDVVQGDEYGSNQFRSYLHLFTKDGRSIDSIVVAEVADFEDMKLRNSFEYQAPSRFHIKNRMISWNENGSGDIVKRKLHSSLSIIVNDNSVHVDNKMPFVFYGNVGFLTFDQILEEFTNSCYQSKKTLVFDIDGNGKPDLVSLIERDSTRCSRHGFDLVISTSDQKGIFKYTGRQGEFPSRIGEYVLKDFAVDNHRIQITFQKNNNYQVELFYEYRAPKQILILTAMKRRSHSKDEEVLSDLDLPFQKSFDYAKSIVSK